MGDFRKKNNLLTDLEGKNNLARKYLGEKISCTEKKITSLYVWGKDTLALEVWEKILNQITHIPIKSQMVGP